MESYKQKETAKKGSFQPYGRVKHVLPVSPIQTKRKKEEVLEFYDLPLAPVPENYHADVIKKYKRLCRKNEQDLFDDRLMERNRAAENHAEDQVNFKLKKKMRKKKSVANKRVQRLREKADRYRVKTLKQQVAATNQQTKIAKRSSKDKVLKIGC